MQDGGPTRPEGQTRREALRATVAAGVVASAGGAFGADSPAAPAGPPAPGVKVEARMVPWPKSISPQARATLARFVRPDGSRFPSQPAPAPGDVAGWADYKRSREKFLTEMLGRIYGPLASTAETVTLAGVVVHVATPPALADDRRAFMEIHGGALVIGGGEPCRIESRRQADIHGVRCYAVDYRMPPEHPYPAALDDCIAVYRALVAQYRPENLIVGGASAGGNLAAALMLRARDEGLPLPAALVLISPEADLTESGDSFETNRDVDVVLNGSLASSNALYAAGHDLAHPYLSPLFGDFSKGFPPTFLQAGTRDLFLSNTARMHRALRRADVPAELHVFEGMPHGGFSGAPEDHELSEEMRRFTTAHWGRRA